ncbi:MAG: PDDEXK nuclease domain-containing protein [Myxococcales bacterium]
MGDRLAARRAGVRARKENGSTDGAGLEVDVQGSLPRKASGVYLRGESGRHLLGECGIRACPGRDRGTAAPSFPGSTRLSREQPGCGGFGPPGPTSLCTDTLRHQVAQAANAAMTTLYWEIGTKIRTEVLEGKRASYGKRVIAAVGRRLESQYGSGFGEKSLRRMLQFAQAFPDREIVAALRRQLGWTHFKEILPIKDGTKREFYAEMCRLEGWSTRVLRQKVDGMLFERTALSKKPDQLIRKELAALRKNDEVTPELVFQDPYLLDFLGLKDTFIEEDLEAALLREVERFLLELGTGFAVVARQKRIVVDGND